MKAPVRTILLLLGLAAAGAGAYGLGTWLRPPPELVGTALQDPPLVGTAELLGDGGRPVTLAEVGAGAKATLVFFGFVNCPDVCPLTMAQLARIYSDLGEPADLRVVLITVDPARDTPEIIASYAAGFHPAFVGLSGSNPQIATVARTFYAGVGEVGDGRFNHSDFVAVVDAQGRFRYVYSNDKVPRLVVDLPVLMRRL